MRLEDKYKYTRYQKQVTSFGGIVLLIVEYPHAWFDKVSSFTLEPFLLQH